MPANDALRDLASAARKRREAAQKDRAEGVRSHASSSCEHEAMRRLHGEDHAATAAAAARNRRSLEELKAARSNERRARVELQDLLATHLPRSPEEEVALLDGADPIVLLPVRLETRFERRAGDGAFTGVLKVRIYPDAVAADLHEPRLSESERDAGFDYWRKAWSEASEADAWTALVAEIPPTRAAWVVKVTTPKNFAADFPAEAGASGPPPVFPDVGVRPPHWQRAPSTSVLPDRWLVLAYRGGVEIRRAVSQPVIEPLTLSLTLSEDGTDPSLEDNVDLSNGLQVKEEIGWTLLFPRALAAGMAVELPFTEDDFTSGIEQLLVLGVKSSLSAADGAERFGELIDAHHYSRGFSFVPQGAATNNVGDVPSWFPQPDPAGTQSFRVERGEPLVSSEADTDGSRFMRALGVSIDRAAHIARADADERVPARAMAEVLWPCTLGYFLEHMMRPVVNDEALRLTRQYVVEHVRGRGPFPAFRVGDVPYGLLPVTFIDDWDPFDDPAGVEHHLKPLVTTARNIFGRFIDAAPHVGKSDDADRDLLETLGIEASAREAWVRRVLGMEATWNFARFSGVDPARIEATRKVIADSILAGLGHPEWDPRVLYSNFSDPPYRFASGLVVNDPEHPLSETAALDFNYINWLRTAGTITGIRDEQFPAGLQERPRSLLYLMLRHGALQQFTRCALDILIARRLATTAVLQERELIGITAETRDTPTLWTHMQRPVAGITGGRPIDALPSIPQPAIDLQPLRDLNRYREALAVLENLPTAELERLFTETMDVCSHRVDAWITAMASRRLEQIRVDRPAGCHLAAYGWVENLHPDRPSPGTVIERDRRRVRVRDDSGGYVYAPSMTHGAAAAVLLNAYLTRQGTARERYAVNLSSRRTRIAMEVLAAVRNGNPLGAVLGYQFERGLHEGHSGVELDEFIDDFRADYPVGRNEGRDANEPAESIVARNVVDGLALRMAWRGEPGFDKKPWETISATTEQRVAIEAELARLDETVDAVSDLLLADSVFQFVGGRMDATGASLKAVGEGARPPEGDVAKVPRSGTALTHRVVLIVGGNAADVQAKWGGPHGERARAEPRLNLWIAEQLGDPATVGCEVHFGSGVVVPVTLRELDLDALDVLALAHFAEESSEDSELDRRVRRAVGVPPAAGERFAIRYQPEALGSGERSFAAVLEMARALNELLGAARPLAPKDLIVPERSEDLESQDPAIAPDLLPAELQSRAVSARIRFTNQRDALAQALTDLQAVPADQPGAAELGALRTALRALANFGIAGAYPRTFSNATLALRTDLTSQAESVLREAEQRLQKSTDTTEPVEQLKALFGRDYFVVPRFRPARPTALQPALDTPPSLGANPNAALAKWSAQTAHVRKVLGFWKRVQQYARAFGAPAHDPQVAQLPFAINAAWVGLPFAQEADRPLRGLVSVMLQGAAAPPAADPWAGILLDEWMESIPHAEEDAGIVLHHDSPGAEAPQAVLIAVPPARQERWSLALLVKTLQQTLFHAKVRAVDREHTQFLYGQMIPMIYLQQNTRRDTVSTAFNSELLQHAHVFQSQS